MTPQGAFFHATCYYLPGFLPFVNSSILSFWFYVGQGVNLTSCLQVGDTVTGATSSGKSGGGAKRRHHLTDILSARSLLRLSGHHVTGKMFVTLILLIVTRKMRTTLSAPLYTVGIVPTGREKGIERELSEN